MKHRFATYYLFILSLVFMTTGLKSQELPSVVNTENIQLCTDRTLYISGENILFSAVIFNEKGYPADDLSRILYVEIITADGTRVGAGKYPVEQSSARGCIRIPDDMVTGMYYLKSYTRFMRNESPDHYQYILLKIINPYKSEVLNGHGPPDTTNVQSGIAMEQSSLSSVKIYPEKSKYSPRDSVILTMTGETGNKDQSRYCVSVIPAPAFVPPDRVMKNVSRSLVPLQFYPETRGLSITGTLLDNKTRKPVPSALVNLSIIGDKDMMAIRTDSSGRYFFALPYYYGNKDIFLCAENVPGNTPEIFIENDFCPKPVKLPSPEFQLTEDETETAYNLAVNHIITSKFQSNTISTDSLAPKNTKPFYGDPTEVLVVDKYIDLPTVEEYFNELPLEVKVRKSQGRKHFRFYSDKAEMTIYDPLVLIDWVAVDDIDRVLALQPKALDRIELVNSPYIKGNITYGGIISFVSKNNDFAGIDLPLSGTFINYKFLEECSEKISDGPLPANLPDSRNTVYWNPDLKISDNTPVHISFTAPDTPGKYIILLRAMTAEGVKVLGREEIEIVK